MTGVQLIGHERSRQIVMEAFGNVHDDGHIAGELALAAAVYASPVPIQRCASMGKRNGCPPAAWPFSRNLFKPGERGNFDDRIRELAKAGALIAAEIDRLQRLREKTAPTT